ncbi:hypothetical protein, partial [Bacillus mycoides]|uniref:hypothetical protein n=1 Tax=Bacillus mycoides TaxID=1405 RepID=UPI003D6626A0
PSSHYVYLINSIIEREHNLQEHPVLLLMEKVLRTRAATLSLSPSGATGTGKPTSFTLIIGVSNPSIGSAIFTHLSYFF